MEVVFYRNEQETQISYGETLASVMKEQSIEPQQVIILTNQRYYDRFSEKVTRLFLPREVNWYICTNQMYCNNFSEFKAAMDFFGRFSKQESLLIVGFGNEGVLALSSFIHATSVLTTKLWLIPVSLRALAKSVKETAIVVKKPDIPILENPNTPQFVIFDQTIAEKQIDGKLVDFLTLIRGGVLADSDFLKELYRTYPSHQALMRHSLAAYTNQLIQLYQQSGGELEEFGQLFADAAYRTENGHLLSDAMKLFFGFLFHFIWTVQQQQLTVDLPVFCQWLTRLGFPIELPESFSLSEYFSHVLELQQKEKKLLFLAKVGTIGGRTEIEEKDLVQTMETYQRLINEIRGV